MYQFKVSFYKAVAVCLTTLILQSLSYGQSTISKENNLDKLFTTFVNYKDFSGSVLIANEGEVIYKNAFGLANMELNSPNSTTTKHRLASVSKQFTAMLILQLVAKDQIDLDESITTYLPDYPKENGDLITVHHLLNHTSGIPNYTSFPNYKEIMRLGKSPVELVEIFKDSSLHFKPGDQFDYSNSGYVLLGFIIEKITGKSYGQVLQENIFEPLKMKNSGYEKTEDLLKNRSSGYYKNGKTYKNANFIDMSVAYSAGGIYSTVEDMFLWDQALYSEKLLPQKYIDLLFQKHIPAWGQSYGYGWMVGEMNIGNTKEKIEIIEHSGDINGFKSHILRIPSTKSTILLLSNVSGAPLYEMANAITGILYDKTYDLPKKSLANSMSEIVDNKGISYAISFFQKNKVSDNFNVDENEINNLGYEILQSGNTTDALSIFKLNVETFPGSSNAYDSYAEAHMLLGNKSQAIENYQKSIELNPRNENGKKMLEKLGIDINQPITPYFYFLDSDSTWTKEIFHFPIRFAKDIDHKGLEDARFPQGWAVADSETFWSYVFAWKIEGNSELNEHELEDGLQKYFHGLMRIEDRSDNDGVEETTVKIQKIKSHDSASLFSGVVNTLEAFFTLKAMTLNVKIEQHLNKKNNELIIVYRFSPKSFDNDVWKKLEAVQVTE